MTGLLRLSLTIVGVLWVGAAGAQVAETTGVAVKAADGVLTQGPVADVLLLWCIVASVVALLLWRANAKLQERRFTDMREMQQNLSKISTDATLAIGESNKIMVASTVTGNAALDIVKLLPALIGAQRDEAAKTGSRIDTLYDWLRDHKRGGSQ